ncbi:MAG: ferric reductase [Methylobacterium sp.]|nr:MAG: ferric reductase [Methylobacterium sp.]
MPTSRAVLIWAGLAIAIAVPSILAALSPLLAWRDPVYIVAGFAGLAAMVLVLVQPLLAGGLLPGLPPRIGRRVHRFVGIALVLMVVIHVAGLWKTSAPDVIDALLFESPTAFSPWGVVAMWAVFAAALLAALRGPLRINPLVWRIGHSLLAVVIAVGTVVHAVLIEGPMEPVSKALFGALVLIVTAKVLLDLRAWALLARRKAASRPSSG